MTDFVTKFEFKLPKGYIDKNGTVHKEGIMRLATGADEIIPLKDPRVLANPAYHVVILLSRVIESLGSVDSINPKVIEDMFSVDLAYLQEFYNRINGQESNKISVTCPNCQSRFEIEPETEGE